MNLTQLPLTTLAGACQGESAKFQRGEPSEDGYCFELFRRAICERDDSAWEAVLAQYRGMVLAWVRRRSPAAAAREGDDYWVNRAFERFWAAIGPQRFGQFDSVAALVKYLQMCVFSVLADEARARESVPVEALTTANFPRGRNPEAQDAEATAMSELTARELWETIKQELAHELEQRVIYLSFSLGLKPQEIHRRHPDHFPAVADVYRIKRNVLERLRRSPEIRRFLQ
jgi:hypothetical protein